MENSGRQKAELVHNQSLKAFAVFKVIKIGVFPRSGKVLAADPNKSACEAPAGIRVVRAVFIRENAGIENRSNRFPGLGIG